MQVIDVDACSDGPSRFGLGILPLKRDELVLRVGPGDRRHRGRIVAVKREMIGATVGGDACSVRIGHRCLNETELSDHVLNLGKVSSQRRRGLFDKRPNNAARSLSDMIDKLHRYGIGLKFL